MRHVCYSCYIRLTPVRYQTDRYISNHIPPYRLMSQPPHHPVMVHYKYRHLIRHREDPTERIIATLGITHHRLAEGLGEDYRGFIQAIKDAYSKITTIVYRRPCLRWNQQLIDSQNLLTGRRNHHYQLHILSYDGIFNDTGKHHWEDNKINKVNILTLLASQWWFAVSERLTQY